MVQDRVYLAPQILPSEYSLPTDQELFSNTSGQSYPDRIEQATKVSTLAANRYRITYSLLHHYMHEDPHIVVKKFPTKLLRRILLRNIPVMQNLITKAKLAREVDPTMTVEQAIIEDLSHSQVFDPASLAGKTIFPGKEIED